MKPLSASPTVWAVLLLCSLGLALPARAAKEAASNAVTLSFSNAEIEGVARTLSVITHHNIVVDPRVKGTISLNTDSPVTPAQAWEQFLAALRMQGYTIVETGGLFKIIPEADGKLQSASVRVNAANGGGDQIVTEIFKLSYENANNLVSVLRPLISANNVINVNAGNNSLVITDYANNLGRLRTIIAALDTPSATDVEVMPLQYAAAAEMAVTVRRLTESSSANSAASAVAATPAAPGAAAPTGASAGNSAAAAASIVADTQSNSLLVRAPNPVQLAFIRSLVARLDHPRDNANVRVVYLKNTDATRLAQVLRAAFPSDSGSGSSSSGSGSSASSNKTATAAVSSDSSSSSSSSKESAQSTTPVAANAQPSTGGGIQADPASNSLIITAPEPKFKEMRQIIEQLDSRRAQLYVESLVVEVDASKSVDLGVQWSKIFDISSSTTLTLGTVATALESMSGTNILSTANVVTLDNEEAKIVVGQNVPFITGSYTSTSSSSPFQTIERKDVGITLRIKPQIGQSGNIRMTIYQESSSVASTSSTLGPTTNKRSIESTVMVNDGKIIVLGGLIEDSYTNDASQVPAVADIPLLGAFFRSISRARKKTNLIVFLRPVVMADETASSSMSLDRYDYIRAQQQGLPANIRQLPEMGLPLAPLSSPVPPTLAPAAP
ncbi:secretin N-terminal domain-containing protein [Rhodoferax sp.]|uniref:secretin N-terminal domain-containing protein n=1 Tax=Rhodoferax sp. TaxID=50421 RepID=UPI00374CFB53